MRRLASTATRSPARVGLAKQGFKGNVSVVEGLADDDTDDARRTAAAQACDIARTTHATGSYDGHGHPGSQRCVCLHVDALARPVALDVGVDDAARATLIRAVLDQLAADHPDDDTLLDEARATLAEATQFVADRGLVALPDEPVQIIEMPEFNRGVSIAYCDAPGPFEKSRETFYAIAPPPAEWPAERRESFYREYNSWMLVDLTIHEAMPGHYLQLAHAGKVHRPLRAVFSSGTFVEGWALYSEWMMGQEGFGGPEVELQRLKMVLRLCINALLDHGVHTGGMTEEQAMTLMTERGFQEDGEAAGKWRRACLTSAQLSTYLVGMIEVMDIRRDFEDRAAGEFDLREFNDLTLSQGSIAPRHIRALMMLPSSGE